MPFPSRLVGLMQICHHLFPSSAYSGLFGGVDISKSKKARVHLYISRGGGGKQSSANLPYIYITQGNSKDNKANLFPGDLRALFIDRGAAA